MDRNISTDKEFVKIDLHIHTPASTCYKGEQNDEEYLRILEKAKEKELKVIAITDHNSINGYRKIQNIKNNLIRKKNTLTDSEQTKLKEIAKKLVLFQNILILPGVEFEVRNGIHMLVIFNTTVQVDKIEKFLIDGGYDKDSFGEERPSTLANWDIFSLYEESQKYDCLVIDAHTDSNKGILNTIPKGLLRANCFKSSQLHAVGYCNEIQKEKLFNTITTSKEYKREAPLAFVKFSDAHSVGEIGTKVTWVKLDKINFESLKNAFLNPSEMVSTERPFLEKILNRLLGQNNSFGIRDFSDDNKKFFKKLVCAMNNAEGGYALFGVTERKNKIGLPMPSEPSQCKEQGKAYIEYIIECFNGIDGLFQPTINSYRLQNGNIIFSIHVAQNRNLISIKNDGRIYSIKSDKVCTLSA